MKTVTERASAYLAKIPVSIATHGGDAAAFRAAVALVRGFDLSEQEALPLLSRWNATCDPPGRENDLRHKLRCAATSAGGPAGYLLNASPLGLHNSQSDVSSVARRAKGEEGASSREEAQCSGSAHAAETGDSSSPTSHSKAEPQSTLPSTSAEQPPGKPEACATPAEDRAWLRKTWPEFHPLTHADIRTVAELRGIFPDAVDLAQRHGFLQVAEMQGQRCLVITEGTFAQVRRLDGQPLVKTDGTRIKARNLTGSQGAFIGQRWLGETTHVLLVEGAIGLIEGLAAMLLVDTPHAWSILAATSASSRFARDAALLERLRGREVHIIPDTDAAGMDAAASWLADLQSAGVYAIARLLPKPLKDLGDVLHRPEAERQPILDGLFTTRK